ncbi:MAG: type II secretion system F family protein [Nanoarchaeota archaeon]|nr:type II secretion system F family protein [Nanoarchaeota archaeon]MBU1632120.1 type II secretion system F family protein [Nanoarchaeota archaeon]MBU1876185.1 type II secretion system F family protein [Nanoarchaeota archaeon]
MIFPKLLRDKFRKLVIYSDIELDADRLLGFILVFGLFLAVTFSLYFYLLFKWSFLIVLISSLVALELIFFYWIILRADRKAKIIENYLPDALLLMSSNLKSGLTTDKALLLSARPDFGPLEKEIKLVSRELMTGKELPKALSNLTLRVKSESLNKTINLINSGIKSGGQLVELLEQSARNLRGQDFIKKKIEANVLMYVIFIFAAVGVGAPTLFALSSFLVEIISQNLAKIEIPEAVGMAIPIKISQVAISLDFVIKYAVVSLTVTAILGSLILGLISKGEEKQGIKIIPFLVALALTIFFLIRFVVSSVFLGLVSF